MVKNILKLPVEITNRALIELKKAQSVYKDMPCIRLAIKGGGGCGGVAFTLGLDKPTEQDNIYIYKDLNFTINKGHLMHLVGLRVDYIVSENEKGFVFNKD